MLTRSQKKRKQLSVASSPLKSNESAKVDEDARPTKRSKTTRLHQQQNADAKTPVPPTSRSSTSWPLYMDKLWSILGTFLVQRDKLAVVRSCKLLAHSERVNSGFVLSVGTWSAFQAFAGGAATAHIIWPENVGTLIVRLFRGLSLPSKWPSKLKHLHVCGAIYSGVLDSGVLEHQLPPVPSSLQTLSLSLGTPRCKTRAKLDWVHDDGHGQGVRRPPMMLDNWTQHHFATGQSFPNFLDLSVTLDDGEQHHCDPGEFLDENDCSKLRCLNGKDAVECKGCDIHRPGGNKFWDAACTKVHMGKGDECLAAHDESASWLCCTKRHKTTIIDRAECIEIDLYGVTQRFGRPRGADGFTRHDLYCFAQQLWNMPMSSRQIAQMSDVMDPPNEDDPFVAGESRMCDYYPLTSANGWCREVVVLPNGKLMSRWAPEEMQD